MKRLVLILLLLLPLSLRADPIVMIEPFIPGTSYVVECRINLTGELQVPVDEGSGTKKAKMKGEGVIKYDERVLPTDEKSGEQKALRIYRQIDFERVVADRPQDATLRREVSRLVVVKSKQGKMAFSPDGPLTWGELDLIRTDLFVPALGGLLPINPVKPGDRWKVSEATVKELTDMEVEDGKLDVTFIEETTIGSRRLALLKFSGELKGVNEDGAVKQVINGTVYYDLDDKFISYLSVRGEQQMLDKDRKNVGNVEGVLVLTRRLKSSHPELRTEAITKLKTEPNDENTLLLYENPDLGVKLTHSRRWRVGRVQGRQITLDETTGNGLLITVEPLKLIPTTEQFLRESKDQLTQKKARFGQSENPVRLGKEPIELDRFAFEVEVGNERAWMDYYVARQPQGGACFAARLISSDRDGIRKDVEKIARSLVVMKKLETK